MIEEGEVDFAFSLPGLARFRVNAFRQRGSTSIVCRRIPFGVMSISYLVLPQARMKDSTWASLWISAIVLEALDRVFHLFARESSA